VLYDYSVGSSGCAAFLPSFLTRIIYEPSCDPLNTYYWMSLGLSATAVPVPLSLYISLSYFLFLLYVTYSCFYARHALDLAASFFDCLFCGSRRHGQVPHIKPALSCIMFISIFVMWDIISFCSNTDYLSHTHTLTLPLTHTHTRVQG